MERAEAQAVQTRGPREGSGTATKERAEAEAVQKREPQKGGCTATAERGEAVAIRINGIAGEGVRRQERKLKQRLYESTGLRSTATKER